MKDNQQMQTKWIAAKMVNAVWKGMMEKNVVKKWMLRKWIAVKTGNVQRKGMMEKNVAKNPD
jgi:hypothetical protein